MRFSNYYIFFVKALFYLLLIQDKLFILLQLIWDLLATRKKNEPSISCTGQQRLALMGHWKKPYSNFIFCHLNDVSSSSGLFRRRGPYKTYVIRHYWCSLCFFCFCFTHWFLYLFHCFLFIICCLYMVSLTSSVFCLQFQIRKYIAYQFIYITFLLPGQSAFQQIFAPFGNSILFFWPKFPTSRRFTKKYLKFYLKTVLLCGHREAQQVLSCINQGKTFKMNNWK